MPKFRTAIIGLGKQALDDHIPAVLKSTNVDLVAVCDTDENKLNSFETTAAKYNDFRSMMKREAPDFVIAVTPHNVYNEIIETAGDLRIHIMKEKPFAMNLAEAKKFYRISEETGIQIMTTSQRRFNPVYNSFFQLKDAIGKPLFADARYTLALKEPHKGWRGDITKAGGGCIIDMGYHMIDMFVWYLGLPSRVHAEFSKNHQGESCDVEDMATVMMSYENDLYGSLLLSRVLPPKTEHFNLLGANGRVEVQRGSIKRFDREGNETEALYRDGSWGIAAVNQVDYFCEVLRGKKENIGSPKEHLKHVSIIDACYKSKEVGCYVSPAELLREVI